MQLQRKIRSIIHRYNDKRFAVRLLKWMMICIGIAIVAALVLPVIIFLTALMGVIILIRLLDKRRRNKILMMNNNNRIDDVFDFISPILLTVFRSSSINANYYYCVDCGTKHKETACPSCGSKFKKTIES
ncbi:MAG: zinc ribbon domain-containing protein [Nitrososphaeraceae archaeon]